MLAPELTPRTARRERRREKRQLLLPSEHEELFLLLAVLRAASAEALHALHFVEHSGATSIRSTYRALTALERAGFLERQMIPGSRAVYRMTARAYASSPRVRRRATETVRRPLSEAIAGYCWLRAATWAELKKRGYCVGRDGAALHAVRRFVVDAQRAVVAAATGAARADAARVLAALRATPSITPMVRSKCARCATIGLLGQASKTCATCGGDTTLSAAEHRFECAGCGYLSDRDEEHRNVRDGRRRGPCRGPMREMDHVPFDVAWRESAAGIEVVLVVVDDPTRSLRDQLNALPLRVAGKPAIPIALKTIDSQSVFDPRARRWISTGERHRELLRAFSPDGDRHLFPFSTTARVVEVRPELQLRLRGQPAYL
jgi:hypothetical protein